MERRFLTGLTLIDTLGDLVNASTILTCLDKMGTFEYFKQDDFEVIGMNEITADESRRVYRVQDLRYAIQNYELLTRNAKVQYLIHRFGYTKLSECLTKGASEFNYFGVEFTHDLVKESMKLYETQLLERFTDLNEAKAVFDNQALTSTHYDLSTQKYVRYDNAWRHFVDFKWLKIPRGTTTNLVVLSELGNALRGAV
ncbi:hypothetical protein [Acinetobacter calcoaceticus]